MNFHFKLCTQIGKTCTPLFFCNDNVTLQLALKLAVFFFLFFLPPFSHLLICLFQMLVDASADSNGNLVLSAPNASLVLAIPSYGNLCATAKGIIAGLKKAKKL